MSDKEDPNTRTPSEIRNASIARFVSEASDKFDKGQDEHGGCLDETATFGDCEGEVIDLWHYLQSLQRKVARMEVHFQMLVKFYEENKPEEEPEETKDEEEAAPAD
jgi:hypothetical protein